MSLAAKDNASHNPTTFALVDPRVTFDWRDLDETLNRATNALCQISFKKERRGAVFARNSAETALAYLTCLHAGVSAVPVSSQLKLDEVVYILQDSGTSVLFTGPETLDIAMQAAKITGDLTIIGWRCPKQKNLITWEDWLAKASAAEPPTDMEARTYLQYTSGTTGRPKAIDAVAATIPPAKTVGELFAALRSLLPPGPNGPHLVVGPLYHNAPLSSVRALAAGTPIVVLDRFDPEEVLRAIATYKVATSVMVPTHFQRLLALPEETRKRYDLSSLERVVHTGAACQREVKAAMIEWFGPVLLEAYGGTESGTTNMITSEEWLQHPGSVGKTLNQFELQVIGENGEQLGPNQVGQLFFRDKTGRGIIYRNDPDKTRSAHREPAVFTLGEIGYYDDDDYVYITDRVSDMIVSGGVNIYPAEIERVLLTHYAVADAVVIGIPNADMGEEVKALIIPRDLVSHPTEADLIQYCRDNLAGYKCPRTIDFVADVGRNAIGKVNKRQIRAPYWPTDRTIGG